MMEIGTQNASMTMEKRGLPMLNHVLQHTLRSLCGDSQWVYAIFWRILPRNYPPPKWENEAGALDRSKGNKRNWILVWEDGFCDFAACSAGREDDHLGSRYGNHALNHADHDTTETAMVMHPELFFKMSHEVYNYGEGLMGKVAADNSHKWVYREPMEHEFSFLSPWHGSLDPHPRTWEAQFKAGIQTIAVISVREGLIQLGSMKKVVEDLNFVILMQRKFNYLQSIPGVFVPHPSPLPGGTKRRDGAEGSPPSVPPGAPFWNGGSRDQTFGASGAHFTRSAPTDPTAYRMNPQILGVKRPPDTDYTSMGLTAPTGRDFPVLASGLNFSHGGSRFDPRQSNGHLECPSPPKAFNTGQCPNSMSLLPSMSSLHNLLSKLPSVTTSESAGLRVPPSPSGLSFSGPTSHHLQAQQLQQQQQTFPRTQQQLQQPMSPSSSSADSPSYSPIRSMACQAAASGAGGDQTQSPDSLSPPSSQSQQTTHQGLHISSGNIHVESGGATMMSSPQHQQQPELNGRTSITAREPSTSSQPQQQLSASRSSNPNFSDSRTFRDHPFSHHHLHGPPTGTSVSSYQDMGPPASTTTAAPPPPPKDKLTSFLDSFDQDALTDLDLQDDLENSDTYNSFLSEII